MKTFDGGCSMLLGTGIRRAVPFNRYSLSPIIDALVPSKTNQVVFITKLISFRGS